MILYSFSFTIIVNKYFRKLFYQDNIVLYFQNFNTIINSNINTNFNIVKSK